ncbi:flagellar export chaperone FliS [Mangrovibacter yixingensis]|uniref:flagellar export chaperone FliS n=1 Tax=Mangrovibacter yixingensis TaxID=1529639 RepID=UPI001CFE880F|nr:flagellar export chaperone FliS [Mangrovibacter yixingensis]
MYHNTEDYSGHYQASDLAVQIASANPHQLVLMLFDGLLDELERTKSHIVARRFEHKAASVNKCIDILNALTSALDFDKGGDVAANLSRLYDYCVYRLYHSSHALSVEQVDEVTLILRQLQQGWQQMGLPHD